jgi:Phage integrase family
MLAIGCRVGECLALGWTEVDLDAATADICWRLVRRTGIGLLRVPSTKSGKQGDRIVPLPEWAVDMLRERRAAIGPGVEPVFPDSLGGWRDPNNVRRVWREVRDQLAMDGLVTHTVRKTVASFLDDANVNHPEDQRPARALAGEHDAGSLPRASPHGPSDRRCAGRHHPWSGFARVFERCPKSVPANGQQISREALTWEREPAPGFEPGTARLQVGCAASCAMPAGDAPAVRRASGARVAPPYVPPPNPPF